MSKKLASVPNTNATEDSAKMDAKKNLELYAAADKRVDEAKAALESAMVARSSAAKALVPFVGKNNFTYNGRLVSIASRTTRDEEGNPTGEPSYFFKTVGGKTISF